MGAAFIPQVQLSDGAVQRMWIVLHFPAVLHSRGRKGKRRLDFDHPRMPERSR